MPGSKSEANRALLLAALSDGPSMASGVPFARDSNLMVDALISFGALVERRFDGTLRVTPPERITSHEDINCGLAGTVMRFTPPVAMLASTPTSFYGDARASERPMAPLCDALRQLGAEVSDNSLPFTLRPPTNWSRAVVIDASASSQFISGLLLAAHRFPDGLDLTHRGSELPSRPHIDMTIAMLAARGVAVGEPEPDHWLVSPTALRAVDTDVEPDLTNAAAFVLAGVITGGVVEVPHWPKHTTQAGAQILDIIDAFHACGALAACDLDLSSASELTPVVAALAALAPGVSRLSGIGHIRGHETDRLQAIAHNLGAVGVEAGVEPDALVISGGGPRHGGVIDARGDHRLVHMGALLGLVTPGVIIEDAAAVAKTMPDFLTRWDKMAGAR